MIVNGKEYPRLSRKYDPVHFPILITYTIDGEPSEPLYMMIYEANALDSKAGQKEAKEYIESECGVVQNVAYWKRVPQRDL